MKTHIKSTSLRWLLYQRLRHYQKGMGLMEVLASVVIITVVIVASTPPLMLAMSGRIQARWTEQANFLAQQELERIRLLTSRGDFKEADLPPVATGITADNLPEYSAPTSLCVKPASPTPNPCLAYQAFTCVNAVCDDISISNKDSNFIVQTFRNQPQAGDYFDPTPSDTGNGDTQLIIFRIGVRVYSKAAKSYLQGGGALTKSAAASLQMTQNQGQQRRQPLTMTYADYSFAELRGTKGALDFYGTFY